MSALLLLNSFVAFVLAFAGAFPGLKRGIKLLSPWVPVPALFIGVFALIRDELVLTEYPSLLLGLVIHLDGIGKAFLILTSLVWTLAGAFAEGTFASEDEEDRFRFFSLVTFGSTLLLTVVQDAAAFYAGYALMTIAGYGLVILTKAPKALSAGRIYLVIGLLGEMLTLAGLTIAASSSTGFSQEEIAASIRNSTQGEWSFWLIFIGFGTKVGLVPLHFWLPRSYYWASLPAVAILSGAMTKAGILGWLRFLPTMESSLYPTVILTAGAVMAFYGVFLGLLQSKAKLTLAFSSLSQMGYLTMAFGTMMEPGASWAVSQAAIIGFAFHHGLVKVNLFLGLGILAKFQNSVRARWTVIACLAFCSLCLIGLPFTSGAFAKTLLKSAGGEGGLWHNMAPTLLVLGSIGTSLLMLRFIVLCIRGETGPVPAAGSLKIWSLSFVLVLSLHALLPLLLSALGLTVPLTHSLQEKLQAFAPIFLGSLIAAAITYRIWTRPSPLPRPKSLVDPEMPKGPEWRDLARIIEQFFDKVKLFLQQRVRYRIEKGVLRGIAFTQQIHSDWTFNCLLFLSIGVLLWFFFTEGQR